MKWQRIILSLNAVATFILGSVLIVQHGDGVLITLCIQMVFVELVLADALGSRR